MKQKRIFVIHGWGADPKEDWFPWFKNELVKRRLDVSVPEMPETEEPKIESWVSFLTSFVEQPDENTFFVGHSIGVQAIMRYLESLPSAIKVGGALFVAGWFNLVNLETEKERLIARSWIETPIDFQKVKTHCSKIEAIFSDNDEVVQLSNKELFEERLGARTSVFHERGHFNAEDGVREVPEVLTALLTMMGEI